MLTTSERAPGCPFSAGGGRLVQVEEAGASPPFAGSGQECRRGRGLMMIGSGGGKEEMREMKNPKKEKIFSS